MPTAQRARTELHIDWTRCDGRGLCTELVPDLLGRDTWGFPIAKTRQASRRSDVTVPRQRLDAAKDAVNMCPLVALSMRRIAGDR